jgi:hypothetical protein
MLSSRQLFSALIEKREFLARMRLTVTGRRAYSDSTFIARQKQRLAKSKLEECLVNTLVDTTTNALSPLDIMFGKK